MSKKIKSHPVAPHSVRIWRGFMAPAPQTYEKFAGFLGNVFVPACALLQPTVGLRAYLPSMVPQNNKPTALPDQTALMFWDTPEAHDLAVGAIAVRVYQNLHGDAYDMSRAKMPQIPIILPPAGGAVIVDQPYYLFDRRADWMLGSSRHVLGARPADVNPQDFINALYKWSSEFQTTAAAHIDGALVCFSNDYALAWVHSEDAEQDISMVLDGFTALTLPQMSLAPRRVWLDAGLWSKWNGLDLTLPENISLNIQMDRPENTIPIAP